MQLQTLFDNLRHTTFLGDIKLNLYFLPTSRLTLRKVLICVIAGKSTSRPSLVFPRATTPYRRTGRPTFTVQFRWRTTFLSPARWERSHQKIYLPCHWCWLQCIIPSPQQRLRGKKSNIIVKLPTYSGYQICARRNGFLFFKLGKQMLLLSLHRLQLYILGTFSLF